MTANERRAEIVRILIGRRFETQSHLATMFSVSRQTINTDILALSAEYPIETCKGYGGGVKLPSWYQPYHHILSQEQQTVLEQLMPVATDSQRSILEELIQAYGSPWKSDLLNNTYLREL